MKKKMIPIVAAILIVVAVLTVKIATDLKPSVTLGDLTDAETNPDTYGSAGEENSNNFNNSSDFVVPEPATIFMAAASIAALGAYAYKRKR